MGPSGIRARHAAQVVLVLALAGIAPDAAADEYVHENPMIELRQMSAQARRSTLRTTVDPAGSDTVWVGHVVGTHSVPWSANPSWSGWGPFHVGRGGYRVTTTPTSPVTLANNGYWDFDRFNPGEADTLQGWNAVKHPSASSYQGNDRMYRWFQCMDYGNAGNHRGNSFGKQTYGVLSYWHVDGGATQPAVAIPNTTPVAPTWAPIAGAGSAWCGLRAHGDISGTPDPVTGNYHNSSIVQNYGDNHFRQIDQLNPTGYSDANYPGYGSQWDQILYRDFTADGAGNVTVSFDYRTALSTFKANDGVGNAYGYYLGDPLKVPALNDGNFISASDAGAANAPRDSFMVYVGSPVNDAAWVGALGGVPKPVYDRQRRWFSEVINIHAAYRRIFAKTGVMAAPANTGALVAGGFVPGATVRVAFRVKTDRAYDDEDTYQRGFGSGSAGAAIIDNVVVNGGAPHGFDAAGDIDNDNATPPTDTWKATGKPISSQWHWHNLEGGAPYTDLVYVDPCGPIGGVNRICNMRGNVISIGDHDQNEKLHGATNEWNAEQQDYFISPTINLMATGNGPGFYNEIGIDQEVARATDIRVRFDVFPRGFDTALGTGGIRVAWNFYPAQQGAVSGANPPAVTNAGVKVWSQRKRAQFSSYSYMTGCFSFANPSGANGIIDNLIRTSNVSGVPDSIQVVIERLTVCLRNTAFLPDGCYTGFDPLGAGGGYIDNIAVGFVDVPNYGPLAVTPWEVLQDAFPSNGAAADAAIGTPAFDRLTCLTKSGDDIGQGGTNRVLVAGDSMVVSAPGAGVRLDLVFRVYPGPGNYVTSGDRTSGLCVTPNAGCIQATEGDGSWWGTLMNDVGLFGTYKTPGAANAGGGGPYRMRDVNGGGTGVNEWDPNVWISVRMDTLEKVNNDATAVSGRYMSTIHERDYSADPTDLDPDFGRRMPLASNEGAKILPNQLFTPGTHIEYFFRRTLVANTTDFVMMPDTTYIQPQPTFSGGNWDGIRFASWDALPDRWKDPAYGGPGACMLVANYGSRRGDLVVWDNMARSLGLTRPEKWGAGHGYWSSPTGDFPLTITDPAAQPANGGSVVAANLGHEGSLYDVYDVAGGEADDNAGRLGNRIATAGCPTPTGPTPKMLRSFYPNLILLTADLRNYFFGSQISAGISSDDAGLFTDYITNSSPSGVRSMMWIGASPISTVQWNLYDLLGVGFPEGGSYTGEAGKAISDLITTGSPAFTAGSVSGMWTVCQSVLSTFIPINAVGAMAAANLENLGHDDPWTAAVYVPENLGNGRQARTLVMGWTFGVFGSPDGQGGQQGSRFTVERGGMYLLWLDLLTNMAQGCASFGGSPIGIGDLPGHSGAPFVSFLGLRSENPVRHGTAKLVFGVERTERVEVHIYDVSGRRLRKLADRVFEGGKSHELIWDGADDAGRKLGAGVYFYSVKSGSFTGQRKLTVLRD